MYLCLTEHAKARLQQRYGLFPTPGLAWFLGHALEVGLPTTAGSQSTWEVPYRGRILRFVFDSVRREIKTFLPEFDSRPDRPMRSSILADEAGLPARTQVWYKGATLAESGFRLLRSLAAGVR